MKLNMEKKTNIPKRVSFFFLTKSIIREINYVNAMVRNLSRMKIGVYNFPRGNNRRLEHKISTRTNVPSSQVSVKIRKR